MRTSVVNLRSEPYDVYIGRAGHGKSGKWGNPFVVGQLCQLCGTVHRTGGDTLDCYEDYLRGEMDADRLDPLELAGKVLGCFCKPAPCHGDVLARVADAMVKEAR